MNCRYRSDPPLYVAIFEIENRQIVTILAVLHQREDDYL